MTLVYLDGIGCLLRSELDPILESVGVHIPVRSSKKPSDLVDGSRIQGDRYRTLQANEGVVAVCSGVHLGQGPIALYWVQFAVELRKEVDEVTSSTNGLGEPLFLRSEIGLRL